MTKNAKIILSVTIISLLFSACARGNLNPETTTPSTETTAETTKAVPEPMADDILAPTQQQSNKIFLGSENPSASTCTGLEPLEKVHYNVTDPNNDRGLPTKKISHSHGPASGGKVHHTVLEFQKTFDKYGAFTVDTKSEEKVLYLTFDCGYEHDNLTERILDTLSEKEVPAAFFCTLHHIKEQPELIARMIKEGHIVGNHSASHPSFADITRSEMVKEIEECENYLRENFGYAAKYFRFPAGEYNESALDAVNSIGYVSSFWSVAYSDWDINNIKGKAYAVETVTERLHPGAVILLHSVSRDNADALGEIIDWAEAEGYTFCSLDEYNFQ